MSDLLELTDFQSLVDCIRKTLGIENGHVATENSTNHSPSAGEHLGSVAQQPVIPNGQVAAAVDVKATQTQINGNTSLTNGHTTDEGYQRAVLDAFEDTKEATDRFIEQEGLAGYVEHVLPKSKALCIAHIVDAFEQLGVSLRTARSGDVLKRISYLPRHRQFVEFLYELLQDADIVQMDGSSITRTNTSISPKPANVILQELISENPIHAYDHKLTFLTGAKLADCLIGKADGLQLIFASAEGREVVSGMYGKSPINLAWIRQMEYFLRQIFLRLPKHGGPIRILEMGSGTGGTTASLIPALAGLGIPFIYKVTDISSSLIAASRKRFKSYPFMEFQVVDIEKTPPAELVESQHIIIATNCVHATHSLAVSTRNIRQMLRPDGFLLMLEMTQIVPWVDLVFGLVEGWWLFDDERRHALAPPEVWQQTLQSAGYGHVDWTDGAHPEAAIQRIIIGMASAPDGYDRVTKPPSPSPIFASHSTNIAARKAVLNAFVATYTRDFFSHVPTTAAREAKSFMETDKPGLCVLVTGATGSLGSHLVAHLVSLPEVRRVVCLNRRSSTEATTRQLRSLDIRGIVLNDMELDKLMVVSCDTAKPNLGISPAVYAELVSSVTHIVHNAWPMSITRPVAGFEPQFRSMRNLLLLAADCAAARSRRAEKRRDKIKFLFVSSVATVGFYPLWSGKPAVPEDEVDVESVLPNGYGEAKLVCEKMLVETLQKYPDSFSSMTVRIGQIAGSTTSGYWNPVEHLAFLIKSSQTVQALPKLTGVSPLYLPTYD
jgi:nucleoside-diphosphate-sugar epimerase/SAM-dependent methyltransferase